MRRLGHLLAGLAMALHAFWPLIAQAKPKSVELVPVCTVAGVTHYAEIPLGSSPLEQKSATHHDHCAFCTFGGDRVALSPFLQSIIPAGIQEAQPSRREDRHSRSEETSFGRPRAPPVLPIVRINNDEFGRTHEEAAALLARGAYAGDADSGRGILRLGVLLD